MNRSVLRAAAPLAALCALSACQLAGFGRIQPRHVEGSWLFRPTGPASCGVDSVRVHLRDGDRTWGSFFISGDARAFGPGQRAGTWPLRHGRVMPETGGFLIVFSDAQAPNATDQYHFEGTFDESGGATATFDRYLPDPTCRAPMAGRRDGAAIRTSAPSPGAAARSAYVYEIPRAPRQGP
jgi:hypothetical protein